MTTLKGLTEVLGAHELSYRPFQDDRIAWCICGCSWNINEAQTLFRTHVATEILAALEAGDER